MKKIKRFVAAFLIILLVMSLAACSPGGIVVSSETPEPTPTVVPTPTPTPTPSPTPTVEPTPTPTPRNIEAKAGIKKGQDKVEAEVNQRFEDFLNGTGEFTDKNIRDNGFTPHLYDRVADYSDLGCIWVTDENSFEVQGVILYYEKIADGEVLAFGTKNKSGKRIIALLELPSQIIIETNANILFLIHSDPDVCNLDAFQKKIFGERDLVYYDSMRSNQGKFAVTTIYTCLGAEMKGNDDWSDEIKTMFSEAFDPKIAENSAFMTNINILDSNDHLVVNTYESAERFFEAEEENIVTINCFSDFEEFMRAGNFDGIPNCSSFSFLWLG